MFSIIKKRFKFKLLVLSIVLLLFTVLLTFLVNSIQDTTCGGITICGVDYNCGNNTDGICPASFIPADRDGKDDNVKSQLFNKIGVNCNREMGFIESCCDLDCNPSCPGLTVDVKGFGIDGLIPMVLTPGVAFYTTDPNPVPTAHVLLPGDFKTYTWNVKKNTAQSSSYIYYVLFNSTQPDGTYPETFNRSATVTVTT